MISRTVIGEMIERTRPAICPGDRVVSDFSGNVGHVQRLYSDGADIAWEGSRSLVRIGNEALCAYWQRTQH